MSDVNQVEENPNLSKIEHDPLSVKTTRVAVIGGILLIAVALGIGLILHLRSLISQYTVHAFDVATYARMAAVHGDIPPWEIAEEVMDIYRGLNEEQRSKTGTEEYHAYFDHLTSANQEEILGLQHKLGTYMDSSDGVDDVYIAMYDDETDALVYVVDPQKEHQFRIGEWEPVPADEVDRFLNWDGKDTLFHLGRMDIYGWMCTAGVPLQTPEGKTVAFVLSDVTLNNVFPNLVDYMIRITLGMVTAIVLIIFLMTYYIRKQMVEPINAIAGAALEYVKDTHGERNDHFSSLNIHTGDEIENLSNTMGGMEKELAHREARIRHITAERERVETELHLAHDIQESMLPQDFPPFPERKEFDIYASMDPAKEVGGDFYDFFLIDDDHLGLVIADVSGKGVPAALFMMISKTVLQSCAMLGRSPKEVLEKTNEGLSSNNKVGMFVTIWFGILEISTGTLTAANAGHEYPAIYRKETGKFELLKDKHGLVIGGLKNVNYEEYQIHLNPGDKLFVYTDGVPEATAADNEMFGTDRMIDALNVHPDASVKETLVDIRAAVDAFVKEAEQFDDLTMMCVEYMPDFKPEGSQSEPETAQGTA
ncbi:MAG: SpoIIE family protein phosphatase [Solobacterium sp.]|nr:SpoIIE family protein phosphatase [Solobacterium sp.]